MKRRGRLMVVAVGAALAVGLSACGGGGSSGSGSKGSSGSTDLKANAAITGIVNPSTKQGGVLNVESRRGDCDSFDPQRTYYGFCWTLQRMFTRTLMGFDPTPNSSKVVPDMATAPGVATNGNKTWTYKLRPGIKWQDGSTVTTKDIKYGIERLFATDVINGGPNQYYLCYLSKCDSKGAPAYKGPYKDPNGDLPSIQTPDDNTIVFNLESPVGIMDYLVALPSTAGVQKAKDTKATYGQHVQSDGPFMFKDYQPKQSATWVRNPMWDQATDPIRKPLATQINLKMFSNTDQADAALVAGQYDFAVDNGVGTTQQAKIVTNPNLLKQTDDPAGGYLLYLSVNPSVPPLDNLACRQAIFYAINKSDLIKADGGSYGGSVANSLTPPTLVGFDANLNMYPTGADNTGDINKAKQLLQQCGQPNGFSVKYATMTGGGRADAEATAVQAALKRVGIKVTEVTADPSTYYSSFIGSPSNIKKQKLGMAWQGWAPDFPLPYGYWKSIADGRSILPEGNFNTPSLNDPNVNSLIDQTLEKGADQQADLEKQLDNAVMAHAVYLPYNYQKALFFRSKSVTNLTMLKGVGEYYDIVNAGKAS